jgi:hypothetical protein
MKVREVNVGILTDAADNICVGLTTRHPTDGGAQVWDFWDRPMYTQEDALLVACWLEGKDRPLGTMMSRRADPRDPVQIAYERGTPPQRRGLQPLDYEGNGDFAQPCV